MVNEDIIYDIDECILLVESKPGGKMILQISKLIYT